jgi:acyl carrier protein
MPSDHDGLPTAAQSASALSAETAEATAARLLAIVRELLLELRSSERSAATLTLDSHVERDLALDSLARTELLRRIEDTFQAPLGEQVLLAETPRDLVTLILQAHGRPLAAASAGNEPLMQPQASASGNPDRAQTLIEMLDWHIEVHPDRQAILVYGSDEQIETRFTYASLRQQAQAVAAGLQQRGLQPGQTAAIMLPTSGDYFFGLLRRAAGRRRAGAHLPAGAARAARRAPAPPGPHPRQRPGVGADHHRRRASWSRAC